MSIFLGVHKFTVGEMTIDDTTKSWDSYKKAAEEMGLKPLQVLISLESGVAYCQTEAESEEQIKEAHEKADIPLEDIIKVQRLD
jgi:hypothetical protein